MTPELESAYSGRKLASRFATGASSVAVVLALLPLVAVFAYVVSRGARAISIPFFVEPIGERGAGMANAIVGTIQLVFLASAMGIPLGIMAGLYLAEYKATRLARAVRFSADVLAGVPSILVGVVVYAVVVVWMKQFSAFAGAAALAIVMLPLVARTTDELARAVPDSLREAALALGASRWRTALFVVLRTAAPGIRSGCLLAVARVCGETAPLLFTAYNNRFYNDSLLDPTSTLQVQIFTYTMTPNDDWHAQAWAAALVLVAIVIVLGVVARRLLDEKVPG
ncbi:MAG: phosphate ABC transporter, permease protein PstA [Myxococcales bacterium 68-20]|nr:phosphate ABC transporter permease PstA [Myxococcales bacterium]OJY25208.1 MAG: phosphate ABC transporter, permease protein PstA [Myxococcales bacterium 68-20]